MARPKRRYLVCYIDPKTGRERLGTGAGAQTFAHYVSVENVIRYHISHPNFPPGQYNIYHWPVGTFYAGCQKLITCYKKVGAA